MNEIIISYDMENIKDVRKHYVDKGKNNKNKIGKHLIMVNRNSRPCQLNISKESRKICAEDLFR